MAYQPFPNPRNSSPEGIVTFGGTLDPERLIMAYRQGIFPWPISGIPLPWFCPPRRAILEFDRIHISRSLAKERRRTSFRYTIDQAFHQVISECARIPRPGQDGTWITEELQQAYCRLHQMGSAHSVEVWNAEKLVGGIYGVDAGGAFAGESMFYLEPNASKLGILYLMDYLSSRGLLWMDIQVMTPHMKKLGAREISRNSFLQRLEESQKKNLTLFSPI